MTDIDAIRAAMDTLEDIVGDRSILAELTEAERIRLLNAAGDVFCPDVEERRRRLKARRRQERDARVQRSEEVLASTGIRQLRAKPVYTTPNVFPPEPRVSEATHLDRVHCYICKSDYTKVHHFYDQLCPACAELNYRKRGESADLSGRVALLTGGRIKIGYQAGIKLLRAGARLIVTTRFPRDAAQRYAADEDSGIWSDRLRIVGLDLRYTPAVEGLCQEFLATEPRLDFIINNACQTVRRPAAFYEHLRELETGGDSRARAALDRATSGELFPAGLLDADLQQVDLRDRNSWRLTLGEVSSLEVLETHLVNAVAPFVFNARLKPLMLRTPERDKHIVNVSAVEGQFYRRFKTTKHPHTNMAKAALNMMTRTSAADYHADGIHMNSVDTGWVSDEDPVRHAERKASDGFSVPLDIVDGAARIVDPIISGFASGVHVYGQFLKDYQPTNW